MTRRKPDQFRCMVCDVISDDTDGTAVPVQFGDRAGEEDWYVCLHPACTLAAAAGLTRSLLTGNPSDDAALVRLIIEGTRRRYAYMTELVGQWQAFRRNRRARRTRAHAH